MKFKIPENDRESFLCPERDKLQRYIKHNLKILNSNSTYLSGVPIPKLREELKRELDLDKTGIILTGHQPEFSHPGIIFKNYLAGKIAAEFNLNPMNVIIDYDLPNLVLPVIEEKDGYLHLVNLNLPILDINKTYEHLSFDIKKIDGFCKTVREHLKGFDLAISNNIFECQEKFSGLVKTSKKHLNVIIELRKEWEKKNDIIINDIFASSIYSTKTFKFFTEIIIKKYDDFFLVYNNSLHIYRKKHKIRTKVNPVPDLKMINHSGKNLCELPLWFINKNGYRFQAYTRDSNLFIIDDGDVLQKIKIDENLRPKVLLNTIFLRLILADIFIHGIGGAKYDQISNSIIKRFFNLNPPNFIAATLTRKKFKENPELYRKGKELSNILIKLKNHPEKFLSGKSKFIKEKNVLIKKIKIVEKNEKISLSKQIRTINERIKLELKPKIIELENQLKEIEIKINNLKILSSREFPFFYFDKLL